MKYKGTGNIETYSGEILQIHYDIEDPSTKKQGKKNKNRKHKNCKSTHQ